jgi:anti-sigma regulatory factor (Ser/Thr protein kinase)
VSGGVLGYEPTPQAPLGAARARDAVRRVTSTGGRDVVSEEFTIHDLRRIRDLVARLAAKAGISPAKIDRLVWVVNEFASNVAVHGGGRGRVTVTTTFDGVQVAVTDWGPGLATSPGDAQPAAAASGGRGLWMARQLYPQMMITSGLAGTTVTVFAART